MTKPIRLLVDCIAFAGKDDALAELFQAEFISRSRAEQGCQMYEFWREDENPDQFCVVEIWQSRADLDVHLAQDWFSTWAPTFEALLVGPPVVRVMHCVED